MKEDVETQATFRITGDNVDPDKITGTMAITPSNAYTKGDLMPRHPESTFPTGYWGIESPLPVSRPLVDHLNNLLEIVGPMAATLRSMNESGLQACFYCGIFVSGASDLSLCFDPGLLKRVWELGAELEVHFYVDSE